LIEAIHLSQELDKDALHFAISARVRIVSLCRDGVDLVDENDRGGVLLRHPENITYEAGSLTKEFLDKLRANHANDGSVGVVGDGLGKHGLARAGWAVEKDTTGRVDTNLSVELGVRQRKLDCFTDLLLLNVETTDISVGDVGFLGDFHH